MANHSPSIAMLKYWLALLRAPGIGAAHFNALLQYYPNLEELFSLSAAELIYLGLAESAVAYLKQPDWQTIDADLAWAQVPNHHIIALHDPLYPPLLKETVNPPPLLFVAGDPQLLSGLQFAIVGARNPTPTGLENAYQFAYKLAKSLASSQLIITSGLALGIDGASHQGALKAGAKTIAVLATGLDIIYPPRHKNLSCEISTNGALVSEFPLGTQPRAQHFPQRNRIISGLSIGTLVVEAAIRSGSLITARIAAEQGREVFAIPGSIHNPLAQGCHHLIRQGAKLVETTADIIEELGLLTVLGGQQANLKTPVSSMIAKNKLDESHRKLLQCIGYEVTNMDILVDRTGLSVKHLAPMLLLLELEGYITVIASGYLRN